MRDTTLKLLQELKSKYLASAVELKRCFFETKEYKGTEDVLAHEKVRQNLLKKYQIESVLEVSDKVLEFEGIYSDLVSITWRYDNKADNT